MLGNGLVVVDTSNSLSKHIGNRENLNLVALLLEGDRVSYYDLLYGRLLDVVISRT